jgi:hypothetical protein
MFYDIFILLAIFINIIFIANIEIDCFIFNNIIYYARKNMNKIFVIIFFSVYILL